MGKKRGSEKEALKEREEARREAWEKARKQEGRH